MQHLALDDDRTAAVAETLRAVGHHHIPDLLAGARIERDEPCVGRGDDQVVLIERHAPHRALADDGVRADAVFPEQVAGTTVERLHEVAGVVEIDDAVVDDRCRFACASLVHRPLPHHPQPPDVRRGDLGQRAVAPRLVVPTNHQPVAGRRIAQHRVGHGDVVLNVAGDGQAATGCKRRGACHRNRSGGRRYRSRRTCRCLSPHRGGDRRSLAGRERDRAGPGAVGLKDERRQRECLLCRHRRRRRRHRDLDVLRQLARRPHPPRVHEIHARERRRLGAASQVRSMATGATRFVDLTSRRRLLNGEWSLRLAAAGRQ